MPQIADQVRRQCLALGMDVDEPLAALLIGLAESQDETKRLIEEASRNLADGARGMSPEGEQKAARHIASETWRELRTGRFPRMVFAWLGLAAVAGGCIVFGAGYFAGSWRSDAEEAIAICRSGQVFTEKSTGHRYCTMWLDPEPAKTK